MKKAAPSQAPLIPLLFSILCMELFMVWSSMLLPESVATHFGVSGVANGFMQKDSYLIIMLGFEALLPLFLVITSATLVAAHGVRIAVPNRDFWLDPFRRDASVKWLQGHLARLGAMIALFLCVIHWMVVTANFDTPPVMPPKSGITVLVFIVGSMMVWTGVLLRRFMVVPEQAGMGFVQNEG